MNTRFLFASLLLALPLAANAQAGKLQLPDFSSLAGKARESVDISLDGSMLQSAGQFLGGSGGGNSEELKQALKGVDGIYIRVFEFDQANAYSQADLTGVRDQLQRPGWKKLMSVQSKEERIDMYMREPGGRPGDGGIAIVVSEPKEFVIVNVVGDVDPEKLRQLQGKFGVPGLPGMAPAPPAPPTPPAAAAPGPR